MTADPLKTSKRAANIGAAGMMRGRDQCTWETGTVVTYDSGTHTSIVRTDSGRTLQNVPQLRATYGSFDHLQTGVTVVVSWDLGIPVIVGILDLVGPPQTAIPSPTLTGTNNTGADDATQPSNGINNYKPPHAPTDMTGGDWAHVGTLGNNVAVLEGGVTLFGSPSAQVQSYGPSGMLRSIARRHEGVADFGTWRMENLQGQTSFILRAGSNQTSETGLDEQHWTIRMDLGATGDLFDFSITEPEGRVLFNLHAGSDGKVTLYGDGGVDVSSGQGGDSTHRSDIQGAGIINIAGDNTHAVSGNSTTSVDGDHSHTVGGDVSRVTTGDVTDYAGGNTAVGLGGDWTCVAAGTCSLTAAKDVTANVLGKVSVSALQDTTIATLGNLSATAAVNAKLDGTRVILGGLGLHPAPLFDLFLVDLSTFLSVTLPSIISALTPSNPYSLGNALLQLAEYAAKISSMAPYVSLKVSND
jgi:hypothetical protein